MFSYRRWRHTRGYGVHSPFAFMLVSDILRLPSGYAYYGYKAIEREVRLSHRTSASGKDFITRKAEKEAQLFLRLVSFLNPEAIFLRSLPQTKLLNLAARSANSDIRIFSSERNLEKCRMVCTSGDVLPPEILISHIRKPGASILMSGYSSGTLREIYDAMPEGLLLYSQRNAIIIHRPGMMKLSYSVIL